MANQTTTTASSKDSNSRHDKKRQTGNNPVKRTRPTTSGIVERKKVATLSDKSQQRKQQEVEYLDEKQVVGQTSNNEITKNTSSKSNASQRSDSIEDNLSNSNTTTNTSATATLPPNLVSNNNLEYNDDFNDYHYDNYDNQISGGEPLRKRLTRNLIFAVLASTVGSSFQHGYNIGVINAPEKLIGQFINETHSRRHPNEPAIDEAKVDLILSVIVSIYCVGGCIGALLTAIVADRVGRKEGLFYNNVLVLLACPMMASARTLNSYELLILGRLIIGVNAGLNAGLAPLYLNEVSPFDLRGALGTIYQLVITLSIFLSNIFGLPSLFGTQELWPFLFALPLIPAAVMLVTLPHCCESPKHLLLNKGRELEAQQALAWLRGSPADIQEEMDELRSENERQKQLARIEMMDLVRQRALRKPLIISVVIMLSQQFSGINAVLFFSTSIFRDAGLGQASALKATLGMSLTNVLMTLVSLFLVDKMGRKTLHMSGLMGMTVTCLILAVCLGGSPQTEQNQTSSLIAVASVYLFIIMFASGPGSIPWFIVSELFPSNARPAASSIAVAVNWLANFTVSLCFLPISNVLHGFTFFIFAALLVFFFLFTYYKVPETKGATSEEISALFVSAAQ